MSGRASDECWAAIDPFQKAIWSPSIRVGKAEAIKEVVEAKRLTWRVLRGFGWRVVRVRVVMIPTKKRKPPPPSHSRGAES